MELAHGGWGGWLATSGRYSIDCFVLTPVCHDLISLALRRGFSGGVGRSTCAIGLLELDFEPLAIITHPVICPVTLLILPLHLLQLILCLDQTGVQFATLLRLSLKVRPELLPDGNVDFDAFAQRHDVGLQALIFLITVIAILVPWRIPLSLQSDNFGSQLLILRLELVCSPHKLLMLLFLLLDSGLQPLLELAVLMLVILALF